VADQRDRHAEHDPLAIAALLDDDLADAERATAEILVAECSSCAALHAELVALSVATREQPTPERARTFTLTTADAARLVALGAEPGTATSRLSGVMTDRSTPTDHALHDPTMVASLADHSLAEDERAAAEALVRSCSTCADLHADLLALRAATRQMPTPARPIDFTLTEGDAARLRSRGWRRFASILGTSRDALSRPLAIGLTTLGLAGLLLTSIPSFMFMGSASSAPMVTIGAPAGDASGGGSNTLQGTGSAESVASAAPLAPPDIAGSGNGPSAVAAAPIPGGAGVADGATPGPDVAFTDGSARAQTGATGKSTEQSTATDLIVAQDLGGVSPVVVISAAFLIVGLGLFAMRWTARRYRGD
jgi:anti-sigma factor RsiW